MFGINEIMLDTMNYIIETLMLTMAFHLCFGTVYLEQ